VLRRCLHDQRRAELLQHIAVPLEQQPEELLGIVRHEIKLKTIAHLGYLDRLSALLQSQDIAQR